MVDYDFYKVEYGGDKVDNVRKFNRLAEEASTQVNLYTFGRAENVTDEKLIRKIKMTICKLVDSYVDYEDIKNIKSSSLDDYSVTYQDNDDVSLARNQYKIIRDNLLLTGLLYRGRGV